MLDTVAAGGCVCVPEESERRGDISGAIRRMEVNYLHLTPPVARLRDPSRLPRLRILVSSGEAISRTDMEQWGPHVLHLINGPGANHSDIRENPPWLVLGAGGPRGNGPGRQGRPYRTGDLVRYASEGSILYVGRKDNQIKIHGQRVELEEIEKHIEQVLLNGAAAAATAVAAVPVVAAFLKPQGSNKPILVAYLALLSDGGAEIRMADSYSLWEDRCFQR
ncbi:hypothetical protein ASPACDRAFT_42833 [Aspergillus aculeatus ATCC 16872]|uniref:AMP-dependent synthetase/ligase domain-containing protein n=1 Tax=Aspergillus aculeatus (strain ATCC 16872 / CBS 172.66 / WB 5094) TaxID=690307 RepID=A0A1L9WWF2_ASPA1|nr:uncharacterized protein ASPACDRAFT_42833 [Aspergillus aculeatus ATCC 16872]OJK00248.1 hypothetical protein ASPACDRAFT_42833 [Aspergillus aculeatus ATCC 16872]